MIRGDIVPCFATLLCPVPAALKPQKADLKAIAFANLVPGRAFLVCLGSLLKNPFRSIMESSGRVRRAPRNGPGRSYGLSPQPNSSSPPSTARRRYHPASKQGFDLCRACPVRLSPGLQPAQRAEGRAGPARGKGSGSFPGDRRRPGPLSNGLWLVPRRRPGDLLRLGDGLADHAPSVSLGPGGNSRPLYPGQLARRYPGNDACPLAPPQRRAESTMGSDRAAPWCRSWAAALHRPKAIEGGRGAPAGRPVPVRPHEWKPFQRGHSSAGQVNGTAARLGSLSTHLPKFSITMPGRPPLAGTNR